MSPYIGTATGSGFRLAFFPSIQMHEDCQIDLLPLHSEQCALPKTDVICDDEQQLQLLRQFG